MKALGKSTSKHNMPDSVMCNDQAICEKKEICSVFNNFFINIGPSLTDNLDNKIDNDFSNDDIYSNIDFNPCTAFF